MSEANTRRGNIFWRAMAVFSAVLVVGLLGLTSILRVMYMSTDTLTTDDAEAILAADAQLLLERAQDALGAVDLVLSFLEGASVIAGLGFGAATIYGIRNTEETREELRKEVERVEEIRKQIDQRIAELEGYRPYLENLRELRGELQESQQSMSQTIDNVSRVFQADQEFRLKNYDSAYKMAMQVLANDSDNRLALYIAGWLEVQYLRDQLDNGIDHLARAVELEGNWPAAKAAYGVGLRRKARKATGEERERLFLQAEGVIKEALSQSPRLMDFEGESFWGPVGGILRELGQLDGAINAYENALEVTPSSSYPWGNLATLYLKRAKTTGNPEHQAMALDAFEKTVRTANGELVTQPDNYYLLMDIAQASTILGQRQPEQLAEAQHALESALAAEVSLNSMETSRRGWVDLLENCPEEWDNVRTALGEALQIIDRAIEQAKNGDY
jgi:tetratricopeptide (TPR) repeat protein